jgi:hypothetical protein
MVNLSGADFKKKPTTDQVFLLNGEFLRIFRLTASRLHKGDQISLVAFFTPGQAISFRRG